jgi:potassium efflux system protein
MQLMEDVARNNDCVLDDPAPSVIFQSFGDSALIMILRCYVSSISQRIMTTSSLNEVINETFNEAGIVIAFPQRDLHINVARSLPVHIEETQQTKKPKSDT